jgi:hypothetical protein
MEADPAALHNLQDERLKKEMRSIMSEYASENDDPLLS